MDFRTVIALLMGLLIQLSQVQTCVAGGVIPSCATTARSMACCDGIKSCPCAKSSESSQKPDLPSAAAVELKWLVSKTGETDLPGTSVSPSKDAARPAATVSEFYSGFVGVPLSVAFCRFVI
jgi:hypothetical protein